MASSTSAESSVQAYAGSDTKEMDVTGNGETHDSPTRYMPTGPQKQSDPRTMLTHNPFSGPERDSSPASQVHSAEDDQGGQPQEVFQASSLPGIGSWAVNDHNTQPTAPTSTPNPGHHVDHHPQPLVLLDKQPERELELSQKADKIEDKKSENCLRKHFQSDSPRYSSDFSLTLKLTASDSGIPRRRRIKGEATSVVDTTEQRRAIGLLWTELCLHHESICVDMAAENLIATFAENWGM